ncbi:MAG: hypothetical protein KDB74_01515 [Flavobacteriales bacterium]|nr:hypothetical protein [Flavobacteriales bacterium]
MAIEKTNWWDKKVGKDQLFQLVFDAVENIKENQSYRDINYLKWAALYSNQELLNMYGSQLYTNNMIGLQNRLTLNIIKAVIDTCAARIAKAKPSIMFLTNEGDFSQKRKSKQLTKYLEGVFDDTDLYIKARKAFIHAAVMGTGFLKFYVDYDTSKICVEHVLTSEIIIDDNEGVYGEPRTFYQQKFVDKEVLAAKFPEKKEEILALKTDYNFNTPNSSSTQVLVVESWRLPSKPGAKDGRWAVCVDNCTLESEIYEKSYFPFLAFRMYDALAGYWGKGIAEELTGIQIEINKILRNIQRAQKLMSVPRIWVNQMTNFNPEVLSNEFGNWYKYKGEKPTADVFQAMSQEVYQHLWDLYNKAFEIIGVSQLSATGLKPAGIDSGIAMRTYEDIQTDRFSLPALAYQSIFEDASHLIIDLSKDLYAYNPELKVRAPVGKFIRSIKWADVNLPDDDYIIRAFPVSSLPTEPAAKLQFVQELIQGGYIDKQFGQALLDFPDLEGYMTIANASVNAIEYIMESILEKDAYIPPTPYLDLETARNVAHLELLKATTERIPEENQEMLRVFIEECDQLLEKAQQEQLAAQQSQQALPSGPLPPETEMPVQIDETLSAVPNPTLEEIPPQAVPEAPPISELLPNTPKTS